MSAGWLHTKFAPIRALRIHATQEFMRHLNKNETKNILFLILNIAFWLFHKKLIFQIFSPKFHEMVLG